MLCSCTSCAVASEEAPLYMQLFNPNIQPCCLSCTVCYVQRAQDAVQLLSLAVLLSSMFVFNQMGPIDEAALDRLSLVTQITKHVRVRATGPAAGSHDSSSKGGGADWLSSWYPSGSEGASGMGSAHARTLAAWRSRLSSSGRSHRFAAVPQSTASWSCAGVGRHNRIAAVNAKL